MILPFSTKFKDGTPTQFIEKIWTGIVTNNLIPTTDVVEFFKTLNEFQRSFVTNIDAKDLATLNPKLHSMREDAKDRWKPGMKIHMVVFNRSKNMFQFTPVLECNSVQEIEILYLPNQGVEVFVDGKTLSKQDIEVLAKNDGFECIEDFFIWFANNFKGKIIHWTDLKY